MAKGPIYVTKPFLPPLEEYCRLLEGIWERGILTHNGPLVQQFEQSFQSKFNIKHSVAVSNGTIALQMAIRALGLKGEIITTPFTWVATISAIIWEYCTPVFVDIDVNTFNLDPQRIEDKINNKTCAILPVHVFGNACQIEHIDEIAQRHQLKVIYDAAHAVGVNYHGRSIMEYGDISATSFHATKLLNTAEGGACITRDPDLNERLRRIRFFGYNPEKKIVDDGFNGKMTEVHAAMGLSNLAYFNDVIRDRKEKYSVYLHLLRPYEEFRFQAIQDSACNYSYFPLIFKSEKDLKCSVNNLVASEIFPRRYFYPAANTYSNIVQYKSMPIAEDISKRILCLPLYFGLSCDQIKHIVSIIVKSVRK